MRLKARTILSVLKSGYYILKTGGHLLTAWLTLGWKVRSARRTFEKQLVNVGMPREDAERLSRVYSEFKDQMLSIVKSAITSSRKPS
jgi:hypothetical protein